MKQRIPAHTTFSFFFDDSVCIDQELVFELEKNSILELSLFLCGNIERLNISVILLGEGAHASIRGLYVLRNNQQLTLKTEQLHRAAHGLSDCTIKGILYDAAVAQYNGTIYVEPQAQYTQAKQLNKNILRGALARSTSVPNLQVLTKHVHCSHGSAAGPLDKHAILYMQSRGISAHQAERLLLEGFVADVLAMIPVREQERIKTMIE